ncbi:hypothetical protein pRL120010 [Rhizobium johnstonii 3841]|uniref:Uncharacterized protein n=1 Tax=Rhizobium johnstonii (strain DSM 114642 / LMG 32736 / 3841) TaxID=216596 RepID=Q1M593_RHIJ3|nr:hypothetical protein pRL120010 [Rhizobium johnstonii 3841]
MPYGRGNRGGGHKLEGFGRTDDGLRMLGEQIEEAIFPRHQFSETSSASALHRVSQNCHKARRCP